MTGFFQRIFGKPAAQEDRLTDEAATEEAISEEETVAVPEGGPRTSDTLPLSVIRTAVPQLEPPQMLVGCGHSVGRQRDHNEDALFTLTTTLVSDSTSLPFGLFIVADGMGGHQHGEMASSIAIRAMASHVMEAMHPTLFSLSPDAPQASLQEIMQAGVQSAHRAIIQQTPGGGSTLTGVLVMGDRMTIAHVGDSRAYLIHQDGSVEVLTRDHSLVKRLVELGQITKDEAAVHPQRNVLYRALGQGEPIDAEITTASLPKAGHLLICSDGLWGVISENEILQVISDSTSPAEACQKLVEAANAAGGPDNITAVLIRFPG